MEDLETLQFELESILYSKKVDELKAFATSLKIEKDLSKKSKIVILKIIQKDIDERVNTKGEAEEQVSWFKNCILTLKSNAECQETDKTNKISMLEKEIEGLKAKQQAEMSDSMVKLAGVQTTKPPTKSKDRVLEDSPNSFLRCEYKVSGQIGEPGQTDKLTFVLLTHQIDSGIKHGYKEAEVLEIMWKL